MTRGRRDVTRRCRPGEFVAKLRRIAAAVRESRGFSIQVGGERLFVPAGAELSVEHEREGRVQELELQLRWSVPRTPKKTAR